MLCLFFTSRSKKETQLPLNLSSCFLSFESKMSRIRLEVGGLRIRSGNWFLGGIVSGERTYFVVSAKKIAVYLSASICLLSFSLELEWTESGRVCRANEGGASEFGSLKKSDPGRRKVSDFFLLNSVT